MSNSGCGDEDSDGVFWQQGDFRIVQAADNAYVTQKVGTDPIFYGADVLVGMAAAARLGAFIWKAFGVAETFADARMAVADEIGWEERVQDYLTGRGPAPLD
jgi:hypothetical protein